MKIILLALLSTLFLVACGSKPAKTAANAPADAPKPEEKAKKPAYDTSKPISYAEYKRWRAENDPESNAYAEYKQWEINQRKWKKQTEQ